MELADRAALLLRHGTSPVQVAAILDIPLDQIAAYRRDRAADIEEGGPWQPVNKADHWLDYPLSAGRPAEYKILDGLVRLRGAVYRDPAATVLFAAGTTLFTMPDEAAYPDKPRNVVASVYDMENVVNPINGVWRGIVLGVEPDGTVAINGVLGGVLVGGAKSLVIIDGLNYDLD